MLSVAVLLLLMLQMYCSAALRGPVPALCSSSPGCTMTRLSQLSGSSCDPVNGLDAPTAHLYPSMLSMYQQLARTATAKPELGLLELLLGNQALGVSAAVLGSNYWASHQVGLFVYVFGCAVAASCSASSYMSFKAEMEQLCPCWGSLLGVHAQ